MADRSQRQNSRQAGQSQRPPPGPRPPSAAGQLRQGGTLQPGLALTCWACLVDDGVRTGVQLPSLCMAAHVSVQVTGPQQHAPCVWAGARYTSLPSRLSRQLAHTPQPQTIPFCCCCTPQQIFVALQLPALDCETWLPMQGPAGRTLVGCSRPSRLSAHAARKLPGPSQLPPVPLHRPVSLLARRSSPRSRAHPLPQLPQQLLRKLAALHRR